MNIRFPAVSGSFYPALANELTLQVTAFFQTLASCETDGNTDINHLPKMLIVPHAGYIYSGQVAASAYARLRPYKQEYQRVVVLGPSHHVPIQGIATPDADVFETPLGKISVDQQTIKGLSDLEFVAVRGDAHRLEHSLEVQLPFLQSVLSEFKLIPLVVGLATPEQVSQVIRRLWNDRETLFVISTDLSHFLEYEDAKTVDSRTIHKIEALNPCISGKEACGHYPLNGALAYAKEQELQIKTLNWCNSGDMSGSKDRVVGYASFVLTENGAIH